MEIRKLNSTTIEVSRVDTIDGEQKPITETYDYDFLVQQKKTILEQKAREMAQRDKEIAKVDFLLNECKKLGIVSKPL
jgi:hypothetical protein